VGERLMTARMSLVAVRCSSDSESAGVALAQRREQAHVLDRDDGLVGERLQSATCDAGKSPGSGRPRLMAPMGSPSCINGTASTLAEARRHGVLGGGVIRVLQDVGNLHDGRA
jgi:hypothetical protein